MKTYSWYRYRFCRCGNAMEREVLDVCPECGDDKHTFTTQVARRIDTEVWWNPWSWGNFYYERLTDNCIIQVRPKIRFSFNSASRSRR